MTTDAFVHGKSLLEYSAAPKNSCTFVLVTVPAPVESLLCAADGIMVAKGLPVPYVPSAKPPKPANFTLSNVCVFEPTTKRPAVSKDIILSLFAKLASPAFKVMPAISIALVTAVVTWPAIVVTRGITVFVPRWAKIKTAFQKSEKKYHQRRQRSYRAANERDSEQSHDRHSPTLSANIRERLWFPSADIDV
ncbi:MAG: hypothetical protein ALECFALPRED_004084 [Alectoria fallacina]|uniref:Uncharacterized protein n=1 Tax=Alectoria fallacina TaxID=1903189 RepID=A0A8H3FSK1_9LECA|nr:MAG: hypothetical protein ALECFALPRED_004084 [Alectoria fallacina]